MFLIKDYWEKNHRYVEGGKYPDEFMLYFVPSYILVWLLGIYFSGGYDKPTGLSKIVRGIIFGTITIAVIYAFMPESWRFSRALIALGAMWAIISIVSLRLLVHFIKYGNLRMDKIRNKKTIIVADNKEMKRTLSLLGGTKAAINFIGQVSISKPSQVSEYFLGTIEQLKEIMNIYHVEEIIFCSRDITSQQITYWMSSIGPDIDYKIVPEDSLSIIGSNSANTPGELYTIDINLSIASSVNRRNKRVMDILVSLGLIITFPFNMFFVTNPLRSLVNTFKVFLGKRTWVSYADSSSNSDSDLPAIKQGILFHTNSLNNNHLDEATVTRLNFLYAKDYSVWQDLSIIWKGFKHLGK